MIISFGSPLYFSEIKSSKQCQTTLPLFPISLKTSSHLSSLDHPVIILYQGWDAAGKGGSIKRLVQGMDPRGYEVITTAAPNDIELAHHYLWRFWQNIPKAGHIAIFDRSWYGRVLVENERCIERH